MRQCENVSRPPIPANWKIGASEFSPPPRWPRCSGLSEWARGVSSRCTAFSLYINGAVLHGNPTCAGPSHFSLLSGSAVVEMLNIRRSAVSQAVRQALALSGNNISQVARLLSVSRPTLHDLLKKHKIIL